MDQDHSSNWDTAPGSFQFSCPHTHTLTCKHTRLLGSIGANYLMQDVKSSRSSPQKVRLHDAALQCGRVVGQFTVWQAGDDVGRAPAFTHCLLI